jgi:hypothetical protein
MSPYVYLGLAPRCVVFGKLKIHGVVLLCPFALLKPWNAPDGCKGDLQAKVEDSSESL